jgi:hypothetical protein
MSATQTRRDSLPWYKERWTWLLMLMPATAIVAGFITLWLAITSFDGLVADDTTSRGWRSTRPWPGQRGPGARLVGQVKFSADEISVGLAARSGVELPSSCSSPWLIRRRAGWISSSSWSAAVIFIVVPCALRSAVPTGKF